MTLQRIARRWLTVCLGIFLGVLSMNASAIDSGTVKGKFIYGGKDYALKHVYAWQPPGTADELWVYLTDTELGPAAKDHSKPAGDAKDSSFRGVKLQLDPAKPDLRKLSFVRFASADDRMNVSITVSSKIWQQLLVANSRVQGKLQYASDNDWSLDAEFSAPVFGRNVNAQTLTGAQAQRSPQADVFLAYEKALIWKGVEAASAYTTPERLAELNDGLKQIGADTFKTMQAARQKATAQGEARRKQIEKVVIDGDNAVLEARDSPNSVSLVRLTKFNGNWKVAK